MSYEEIVSYVKNNIKKTAAKEIDSHIAVEFDIYGEGEGAFYVEVSDGKAAVEPYEYYDRDAKIIITSDELIKILKGEKSPEESIEDGILMLEGNSELAGELKKLLKKQTLKTEKKPVSKKTTEKKKAETGTVKSVKKTTKTVKKSEK